MPIGCVLWDPAYHPGRVIRRDHEFDETYRSVDSGGLNVAITMPHCVDPAGALVRTARSLGMRLGDA
jgi:hypothetical protein